VGIGMMFRALTALLIALLPVSAGAAKGW